jgi:uncharacterized membrane protein HdeD (DUF308 family)
MLELLRQKHRRTMWASLIRGLVAIAFGVLVLARPLDSMDALALVVAVWAFVSGFAEIIHALQIMPEFESWWVLLLSGVISVGFGTAAMYNFPELSLTFMVAWVCVWLISTSFTTRFRKLVGRTPSAYRRSLLPNME